nr:unnamed protein product [Callosobruchus analis]
MFFQFQDAIMSKRPIHQYKEEQLTSAMAAIRNGMKIREASRVFGVPRGTLQDRLHARVPEMPKTAEEETAFKDWCIALAHCGFPLKPDDLINTVHNIISEDKRPNPFINNRPGKKWYQSFLRRNPELTERTPENISNGRAAVTEDKIRKWFAELLEHLEAIGTSDILTVPNRIFNGDETSFYICPKSGRVLASRGYKNVYKIVNGKEKEAITVLAVITAAGNILPPCVVFPYVRPPKDVIKSLPDGWLLGKSETGWMKADKFFDYIVKGLSKWVDDQNIQKPVVVFVDGNKSHLSMRLSEYCDQHGIILYALPPNATHMIQLADVSVFRPLKAEWKNTVHEWAIQPENANTVWTKSTFCPLLKKVLEKENLPITITNGFRKCGLYPCDPNALDYSKCVQNNLNKYQNSATSHGDSPCIKISKKHLSIARKVISQLGNDLAKAGVDAKLIVSVLESAKDTKGTGSLNSTDTSTTAASVVDNTSLASNADRNQSLVADPESMQNPDISLPITGDCTLENNLVNSDLIGSEMPLTDFQILTNFVVHCNQESEVPILNVNSLQFHDSDKECTNKDELIPIYYNPENYIGTNAMEPELNMNQDNIEENKENVAEARLDIENNKLINNMEKISVECTLQPNIANTNAKKVNTANLQIEKKESSKMKPIICSNIIIKSTNPSPILKKHLVLPDVSKSTSKHKSINRIGAISSEEWRQFEKQIQEVKEQKKNNILLKK